MGKLGIKPKLNKLKIYESVIRPKLKILIYSILALTILIKFFRSNLRIRTKNVFVVISPKIIVQDLSIKNGKCKMITIFEQIEYLKIATFLKNRYVSEI